MAHPLGTTKYIEDRNLHLLNGSSFHREMCLPCIILLSPATGNRVGSRFDRS